MKRSFILLPLLMMACQTPDAPEKQSESPWIAFHSYRANGAFNLYMVHADSGQVVPLTDDTLWSFHPIWWGDTLSYVHSRPDGSVDRMWMNTGEAVGSKLLPGFFPDDLLYPSPNGRRVAFHHEADSQLQVFVAESDGRGVVQLTHGPGENAHPRWSPDGTQLVFRSTRDGNSEIYKMNADGSAPVRLTKNDSLDRYARWSPAGDMIAFASNRSGPDLEIYLMNTDGGDLHRLTDNDVPDEELCWSPDGRRLVFHSRDTSGNDDLYLIHVDGSNRRRLTSHESYDGFPQWKNNH